MKLFQHRKKQNNGIMANSQFNKDMRLELKEKMSDNENFIKIRNRVKISRNILVKKYAYIFLRFIHNKSIFVFSNQEEYKASLLFKDKNVFQNNFFIPNILKIESLNYYLNKLPKSISRKSQINLEVF